MPTTRATAHSARAHRACAPLRGARVDLDCRMAADELDWNDLRYFLRAARTGTLAGAARAMEVEHSTIGRRLAALEKALGTPLVIRAPDGLHLTPFGTALLPLAEDVERAVSALRARAAQGEARVRLAMPTGFTALFTTHLSQLRAADPNLTLELLTGAQVTDLQRGAADLAIRSGPVSGQDLIVRPLGEVGWSLYAAPAYLARHPAPQDLDDLSGHDVIGYDAALASVPAARWVEARLAKATLALRSREMADMQSAAVAGAGLALLPCVGADNDPGLVRVTDRVLATRSLSLAYPREARLAGPVQTVIRFVLDVMHAHAAQIAGARQR